MVSCFFQFVRYSKSKNVYKNFNWQQNINNNDLENVPTTDGGSISQHNYAIWFRLYNPNSDVGLGQ